MPKRDKTDYAAIEANARRALAISKLLGKVRTEPTSEDLELRFTDEQRAVYEELRKRKATQPSAGRSTEPTAAIFDNVISTARARSTRHLSQI